MTQQPWGQQGSSQQWGNAPGNQWGNQSWNAQPQQQWGQRPGGGSWGNQQWGQQQLPQQPAPGNSPWGPVQGPYPPQQESKSPLKWVLIGLIVTTLVIGGILGGLILTKKGPTSGSTPYVNEKYTAPPPDKNPPSIPEPSTQAELESWLKQNKLYEQNVPRPVKCEMADLDLGTASKAELESHFNEFTACLMGQWIKPLTDAGFQLPRPTITVYEQAITTACGRAPMKNAFYCGLDQQIYYAKDLYAVIPSELKSAKWTAESIIVHEFAHAIQGRTGILAAYFIQASSSSKREQYAISRQIELQADCFSGTFLSSAQSSAKLSDDHMTKIGDLYFAIGDDQLSGNPNVEGNHGHGVNRRGWLNDGRGADKYSKCNTFIAPAEKTR